MALTNRPARLVTALSSLALLVAGLTVSAPASADNVATPGGFTGYGFDQCLAPSQAAMDTWLATSPFWAVGIYISGDSRACRSQPNLTPDWVSAQLRNGWRLLPITLGPQASCNPRFPRYGNDERISPSSARRYAAARAQGRAEASRTVEVAQALGIVGGSTLWYDLETYDQTKTDCRESALYFTSAWTKRLHGLGYVSGLYSNASTGLKALDDARVRRPGTFTLPDRIWIARWDGVANTSTSYLRSDGWRPGGRVKQYIGDERATYGGVTIGIDRDWLNLGAGSTPRPQPAHCGGVRLSFHHYQTLRAGDTGDHVTALQCLLTRQRFYTGALNGSMTGATQDAVRSLRLERGMTGKGVAGPRVWTSLHATGRTRLIKYGAASELVRRLQRALNAASDEGLAVTGTFAGSTADAVKRYQARQGMSRTGVVTSKVWRRLQHGAV
jgi:peptidoglycan hydrolase-like protein with peptidoglycan-binding domain